jgi:hypothetical protein
VLEHSAGGDLADRLAVERELGDQRIQRGSQHVLVRGLGVRAVLAREGDPAAAQDSHPAQVSVLHNYSTVA